MTFLSFLADERRPLVLDTSVLINLRACGYGERVLAALPNDIVVPEVVAWELRHEASQRNGGDGFVIALHADGRLRLVAMTDEECRLFGTLRVRLRKGIPLEAGS